MDTERKETEGKMKKAYFQYYETFEVILEKIKDTKQRGELRAAIIRYGLYGIIPDSLTEVEDMAFTICRDIIDQQRHRCEVNAENAGTKKTTEERMKRPTLEEIAAYCKEKGYAIDVNKFFYHYEGNGWKVGKSAMKSWKATCAKWACDDKKSGNIYKSGADAQTTAYENAFN